MSTGMDPRLKTAAMTRCCYASNPEQPILTIHLNDCCTVSGLKAQPWSAAFDRSRWEPLVAIPYNTHFIVLCKSRGGGKSAPYGLIQLAELDAHDLKLPLQHPGVPFSIIRLPAYFRG